MGSGEEALKAFCMGSCEKPYDLVLMDWKMPGMNGVEATRRIREDKRLQGIPVIMMTAFDREELLEEARQAGVNAFLMKPIKQSLLFDTIMEAFGQKVYLPNGRKGDDTWEYEKILENLTGTRVLLAEDNPINQQVAIEILENAGMVVDAVDNGRRALAAVFEKVYDVVLMDIQMPEMDGYQASLKIREQENKKGNNAIPIVAMTAHAMKGDREKCLAAGMNDYVTKPININKLFTTLVKWVKKREGDAPVKPKSPNLDKSSADIVFPEELSGIDIEAGLSRLNGNRKLFNKLLIEFGGKYTHTGEEIRQAIEAGDYESDRSAAHMIKGMAGNLAAESVFEAARKLEDVIKDKKHGEYDICLRQLEEELTRVRISAKELKTEETASGDKGTDHRQARKLLMKLSDLVEEDDLESEDCLNELKGSLDLKRFGKQIEEIERFISAFDFDRAKDPLLELGKELGITLKG